MIFLIKGMVQINARVMIGLRFVVTNRAREQFAPFDGHAFVAKIGEPLPSCAAARAILASAMRIHLCGYCAKCVRFLFRILIDLAPQLVRLFTVHPPRLASLRSPDLAQSFKHQHATRILGAHGGYGAGNTMSSALIHPANMTPELLVALLPFYRLTSQPLFFRNALEVPISLLIESLVAHEATFDDSISLSHRNDCEKFDIEMMG